MSEKKKVFGYIRVSTETQAEKGYGLEIQEAAITKFCDENGFELIEIFKDEGISGAIGDYENISKRPALQHMLATLNGVHDIVVMNTSRLWRDSNAQVLISRVVRRSKGEVFSVEQPNFSLYNTSPQDFLMNALQALLDEYERMVIVQRLENGKDQKASHGDKPMGMTPFGYKFDAATKKVVTVPAQAKAVQTIYKLRTRGLTIAEIVKHMNKLQIRPKTGADWGGATVHRILNNDFYIGVLTWRGEKSQGNHEAIIEKEVWNNVQNMKK